MVTEETIAKFFRQECNPKEAAAVKKLFEEKPELFAQYFGDAAWEGFVPDQRLPEHISQQLWRRIQHETNRKPVVFYLKRLAAAAVVLCISALVYYVTMSNTSTAPAYVKQEPAPKTIYNNSLNSKLITLADSSLVWLMPQGSLTYSDGFAANRSIALSGGAYFEVTKDANRPFVVNTDSIYTTVLGTKFTVQSYPESGNIRVMLHEGKVSVQKKGRPFKGEKAVFILKPGDVLLYKANINQAYLEKYGINSQSQPIAKPATAESIGSSNKAIQGDNWYMFNNQSLDQVFEQLEILYNTKIDYNKADIKGMTFIGKVDSSDALSDILNSIALLNNLRVENKSNGYLISKKRIQR